MAKKVGRPTVITPEALTKLEVAFKLGATVHAACNFAEVTQMSLSRYCEKHPEYREKIKLWRQTPIFEAQKRVFTEIVQNRNAEMALDYLKLELKKKSTQEYARRWREEHKERKLTNREQRKTERLRQQLLQKELDGGLNDAPEALKPSEYWNKVNDYFTNRDSQNEQTEQEENND